MKNFLLILLGMSFFTGISIMAIAIFKTLFVGVIFGFILILLILFKEEILDKLKK